MHRKSEQALFISTRCIPLAHLILDIDEDISGVNVGVILESVNRTALIHHIQTLGISWSKGQFKRSAGGVRSAVFVDRFPAFPLKVREGECGGQFQFAIDRWRD